MSEISKLHKIYWSEATQRDTNKHTLEGDVVDDGDDDDCGYANNTIPSKGKECTVQERETMETTKSGRKKEKKKRKMYSAAN